MTSTATAVARARRARIRAIELRHRSRATIERAHELVTDAILARGSGVECWFADCLNEGVIEAIAPYDGADSPASVALALCVTHADALRDEIIIASER